ncbi:MAG: hypothetical protein HOY78_48445 [Saccharothrix sp.]|nr:hypothetical protein [Saccharothrix sp.]
MTEVDLIDAWTRWLSGQRVDGLLLWGWPVLYWGRLGKLLQFTAGLVVVLDLLGPDRIRRAATALGAFTWTQARERVRDHNSAYRRQRRLIAARNAADRATVRRVEAEVVAKQEREQERLGEYLGGDPAPPSYQFSHAPRPLDPEKERARLQRLARLRAEEHAVHAAADGRGSGLRKWMIAPALVLTFLPLWPIADSGGAGVWLLGLWMLLAPVLWQFVGPPVLAAVLRHVIALVVLAARTAYGLVVAALGAALATAFGRGERADVRIRLACFLLFVVGFQFDLLAS